MVEIPVLKKKEEERRGGGAPLPFLVRTTGMNLAAGGPRVTGSGLGSLLFGVNGRGGLIFLLRSMFTPAELAMLGVGVLAAAALVVVGLSRALNGSWDGAAGPRHWAFEAREEAPAAAAPREPARPAPGDLIAADPVPPAPPAAQAPKTEEAKADAPAAPIPAAEPAPADPARQAQAFVDAALAGRGVGRLVAGSFGRFGGSSSRGETLRDSLNAFQGIKSVGTLPAMKELGRSLGSLRPQAARLSAARLAAQRGARSTRAMGQLKFARNLSQAAMGAAAEPARGYAANAFEQSSTPGAAPSIGGTGLSGGETLGPLGSGAPDLTAPSVGPSENKTPYQRNVDKAKQGINMAVMLIALGLLLLAAGAMVMLYAKGLLAAPDPTAATKAMAAKLMALGKVLLIAGAAALAAGAMAAMMAKKNGRDVGERSGQREQGSLIEGCAAEALRPRRCAPAPVHQPGNTVHEDVVAEASAGYQNGGPVAH